MKKIHVLQIILTPLLLSLMSCQSLTHNRTPDWVANPKAAYPENHYLAALGEGDTRRAAENAADANLARIFEAHIKSNERILDQSRETRDAFERTTSVVTDINILSSQTLYNIQHAEAWKDNQARIHAIAYLDRRETAAIYRDKIDKKTESILFLLSQVESTQDLLKKYATLRVAAFRAAENNRLLKQLNVISPRSSTGTKLNYSENNIQKNLADIAKQIRVEINVTGDDDRQITSVLEELITRYGFVVGTPAVLKIDGHISINDTGQRTADLVFVRYQLLLQIKEANDLVLVVVNDKGREGHISLDEARIRSYRTLANTIKATGAQRLDAYFDSLIDSLPH